ncbi:MAG: hypothetical protein C4542_08305 [Dehalococcoidia bacterium]|nr:MAG: hypothetical protein C4542_08305 [Dehalococcoidia bacterium]
MTEAKRKPLVKIETKRKVGRPRLPTLEEMINRKLADIEKLRTEIDPTGKTKSRAKLTKLVKLQQEENKIRALLKIATDNEATKFKKDEEPPIMGVPVKELALLMALNCVRNTVIEDYHARGIISQEEMKEFNKLVVNKLYTILHYLFNGTLEEQDCLLRSISLCYPYNWDQPVIDEGLDVQTFLKNPELLTGLMIMTELSPHYYKPTKSRTIPFSQSEKRTSL